MCTLRCAIRLPSRISCLIANANYLGLKSYLKNLQKNLFIHKVVIFYKQFMYIFIEVIKLYPKRINLGSFHALPSPLLLVHNNAWPRERESFQNLYKVQTSSF